MDRPTIVVDCGSATCKAGFAKEEGPRVDIPTVIGRPRRFPNPMPTVKEYYAGQEGISKRGILMMNYPIKDGAIVDWENIETLWYHLIHDELKVSPEECSVLLSMPQSNCSRSDVGRTREIMFEKIGVSSLHCDNQAVLSLFNSGKTTGIVVDSGHESTHIVPVRDGVVLNGKSKTFHVNGRDLNMFLRTMLQQAGYSLDEHRDIPIIADMKEKLCYVSLHFENEMNPVAESSNLSKTYQLPDGNVITLGNERIRCAETMFQPSCLGQEDQGIHKHLIDAVTSCDPEIQKELFRNIVLAGGNTLFKGMPERLQFELKELAPPFTEIGVDAPPERKHSAWIGGSILASLPSFQEKWISKAAYDEFGSGAVSQKGL